LSSEIRSSTTSVGISAADWAARRINALAASFVCSRVPSSIIHLTPKRTKNIAALAIAVATRISQHAHAVRIASNINLIRRIYVSIGSFIVHLSFPCAA
jgi:hypothetical protein